MIVVTGGSGFIGSYVCSLLADEGFDVRIIDIVPPKEGVKAEYARSSILDTERLEKLIVGAESIIHLAAQIDVQASIANPAYDFEINAVGTQNVLAAAKRAGVQKVAYASSAAVYGNPISIPVDESHPANPLSPYGFSKLAAEKSVLLYGQMYGMKTTALRLFNVYGAGQNPRSPYSGVITKFADAIASGKQPIVYGDGEQTRDFVHAQDVARAFLLALKSNGYAAPINIGSGREIAVLDILEKMCSLAGKTPNPKFLSERKGEIKRSVADISLAKAKLGFSPKIALEEGLKEIVRN
ncbi:MAG: NAD-dependent epimerase/dehydratase family protein [Candidatus Anstonellaceae archaeon]